MDISDEESVVSAFADLEAAGWAPDVVVANAGVQLFGHDAPVADLDVDAWRRTIDINLTGTFLTVKHAVRSMLAHERRIHHPDRKPDRNQRRGQGLHRLQRVEGWNPRARPNRRRRVCRSRDPGQHRRAWLHRDESRHDHLLGPRGARGDHRAHPARSRGRPADVEGIMVYLASDDGAFATGSLFAVDGGMTTL